MRRRPLKSYIIIYLTVLLVIGMGLVEVITTVAFERMVLEEKKVAIGQLIESIRFKALETGDIAPLKDAVGRLKPVGYVLMGAGRTTDADQALCQSPALASAMKRLATKALGSAQTIVGFNGRTWGIFWRQPRYLLAAARLDVHRRTVGLSMAWDLEGHYRRLRHSQKAIMAYVFINTLILALVGYYLLWNATGKPISRLLKRAEEFRPEDDLFLKPGISDNEFDKLSRSLNSMLKRISQDQEMLKETIRSLEIANKELVKAQKDVIRAEKLASAGRLASGVAHEIGNPIGIVLGYLDLLRQSGLGKEEKQDYINRAQEEIQRINIIIRQLLDLSKPSSVTVQPISVHRAIEDLVDVVKHQPVLSGIDMEIRLDARPDTVLANADQLRQVFLNLILNASDAISASDALAGKLRISTDICRADAKQEGAPAGDWLVVEFADNGTGMDEEQIGLVFDPFYTNKPPGKGTGLGLSVCFSIVDGLGGKIGVDAVPGEGSTMTIRLPLYRPKN